MDAVHPIGSARASRAEAADRLARTDALLRAGYTDGRAARILARETGMTSRNALRYVTRVREAWHAESVERSIDPAEMYSEHRDRFADLYVAALAAGNLRAAVAAAERLAQLDGLLTGRPVAVSTVPERLNLISDELAEQAIAVLEAEGVVFPAEVRRTMLCATA